MATLKQLEGELEECVGIYSNEALGHDVRGRALERMRTVTAERMAITGALVFDKAEAELQRMILDGRNG